MWDEKQEWASKSKVGQTKEQGRKRKGKGKGKGLSLSEDSPRGGERRPKAEPPWQHLSCTTLSATSTFKKMQRTKIEKDTGYSLEKPALCPLRLLISILLISAPL